MKPTTPSKRFGTSSSAPAKRPRLRAAADQHGLQHEPPEAQKITKILLVDDDRAVRESLHDLLASEGYIVLPAENGQQALDLANWSQVDLVLLDLNMPVKNGWDTFEELTREHPLLPIIIITARANQLFTAASAGAGALLEKPMDIPTLLQAIKRLLSENTDQRLARLVGKNMEFTYRPPVANQGQHT